MKQALWKEYFSFSSREKQGIILLLILIGVCMGTPALWEQYFPPVIEEDSTFHADVHAFKVLLATADSNRSGKDCLRIVRRFHFDPNTITAEEWKELGVHTRTIQTIQHYLSSGGKFRRKEDLQRIYGLSPDLSRQLIPYVRIADIQRDTSKSPAVAFHPRKVIIDINTADSLAWESLSGIGPVLAARIVKFRDKLGGFYAVQQVAETYGLSDSTFKKIQPSLQLGKVSLTKLDINHMDEKSLAQHPYIRYKLARLIVLYRSNNGPFRALEDLKLLPLVDDSIYRKLEHYIKTENSPL